MANQNDKNRAGGQAAPAWKQFELLAATIQRELAADAIVTLNAKVLGRRSNTERQIDVLVEQHVGQFHLKIVMDCKDHRQPVDVKGVEEFIGLVADVGAHKGAMIASNGFTEAAKQRARDAGVDLLRIIDVEGHKWKTYVTVPALLRDIQISSFSFTIKGTGQLAIGGDVRYMPLRRADGSLIDYACNLVLDRWEDGTIPLTPGDHRGLALVHEDTFLEGPSGLCKLTIKVNVRVDEVLHFGHIELIQARGFRDEIEGVAHLAGAIETAPFNFEQIARNWRRIANVKQLAVTPVITLGVSSTYPRYAPNA